jgi:hypothetical protein
MSEQGEWGESHIDGAVNVPLAQLADRLTDTFSGGT